MITLPKIPKSETNVLPSVATFEPLQEQSVRTRLTRDDLKNYPTNGVKIENLREFSDLSKLDPIDQISRATDLLAESAAKVSKSKFASAVIKRAQQLSKSKKLR